MATKRKSWQKCAAVGCRKHSIKNSYCCEEHSQIFREPKLKEGGHGLDPPAAGVLTALCAAVAAKYRAEGDTTKAGVVVAELAHDPPRFYASIARYPEGPESKKIVMQVGKWSYDQCSTAEDAVDRLAQRFSEENRPAQVRRRLEELDAVLGIEDHNDDMEHT